MKKRVDSEHFSDLFSMNVPKLQNRFATVNELHMNVHFRRRGCNSSDLRGYRFIINSQLSSKSLYC